MKTPCIVTGIFNTGSLEFDRRIFRIQLGKAQNLLGTSHVELISIGLKDYKDWNKFAKKLEKEFSGYEAVSFAVLDKVYYQHSVDWLHAQFRVIQFIILSIVILGILNSVSSAILERKQEIGNFRANGESFFDILKLITLEGVFLGIIGSVFGLLFSFIILSYLDQQILMPPGPGSTRPFYVCFAFEWHMALSSMAWTGLAALVATIIAGIKVAKMPIAHALRSY